MFAFPKDVALYPESDGQPMAETDTHRLLLIQTAEFLQQAFPEAYVSGNICLYYEEGNPEKMISPDNLLCLRQGPQKKRIYRGWLPNHQLDLVIEFSSRKTKKKDYEEKKQIYEKILQVPYYLIFDPEKLTLDLFELKESGYEMVQSNDRGYWPMEGLKLQVGFRLPDALMFFDDQNYPILSKAEQAQLEANRERAAKEAEQAAKEAALLEVEKERATNEALMKELAALKAQLNN